MHVWRFTQSPHNHWRRKITFQNGALEINAKDIINQEINSNWVCVDSDLFLTLPSNQTHQTWYISQNNYQDDNTGVSWFEIYVKVSTDEQIKFAPNQIVCDSAIIVSFNPTLLSKVKLHNESTLFQLSEKESWNLTTEPTLLKT